MTGLGQDPILWTGLVMLAGALGAMAARRMKVPAACGALLAGFVVGLAAGSLGVVRPDYGPAKSLLLAFVCFALGAEIDLTVLARAGTRLLGSALVQMAAVTGGVWLAGILLGLTGYGALLVGLAFSASSPTALIAVAAEAGARGPFTQRLYAISTMTLLVASIIVYGLEAPRELLSHDMLLILVALLVGLVLLVPLSRIETRGAMTACVVFACFLLALLAPGHPTASLPILSYLCGFMAANLIPNRQILRDTLRGLALPAVVLLFAGAAVYADPRGLAAGMAAGLLLLAGRLAGLYTASFLTPGGAEGLRHAAAQIPVAGLSCAGPVLLVLIWVARRPGIPAGSLFAALFVSEAAGMIAARWALRRAGEAPLLAGDPDSWRAAMS